ncbi:EAL domain-containing protein [Cohnella phaseoli]|uniref:Diguanylate cyclase (GGDEF)-like protein n=1 Tax=Cohnella phaseoli TaxID=456490 RepID=A0A3D9KCV3_9BACL|nr:EAL domain-containing protein [Cohnella phaseoli]RED84228.1 diguanylate cyclase (GGDEF)-like protein [Cohnella phaseoli]
MTPYKVLIVDDSSLVRSILTKLFAKDDSFIVVGEARNGLEAIEMIVSKRPDLVTMDIEMPVMDGLTALKQIMHDCPVPVIMVSSYTDEGSEYALESLDSGASDFYFKDLLLQPTDEGLHEENFLLRCKVAMKQKYKPISDQLFKIQEQNHQLILESFSHLVKIEEDLTIVHEELRGTLRGQRGLILKLCRTNGKYICMFGEGELLSLFGMPSSQLAGKDTVELFSQELARYQSAFYNQAWNGEKLISYEMQWKGLYLLTHLRPVFRDGEVMSILMVSFDISPQRQMEQRVVFLRDNDALTKLPNRSSLMRWLDETIRQTQSLLTIASIDLDHFKVVNDVFGRNVGDRILQIIARRIENCGLYEKHFYTARIGGDEFVCAYTSSSEKSSRLLAEAIFQSLIKPISLDDQQLPMRISMGLFSGEASGYGAYELLANAENAMYVARKQGGHQMKFWEPSLNEQIKRRVQIELQLKKAIERQELRLVYQPQYDCLNGNVIGFESLIRWRNPLLGDVSPVEFIPIAEESDCIIEIGEWVLQQACRFGKQLHAETDSPLKIAVNLSSKQFADVHLCATVKHILNDTGMNPNLLELEITESMAMDAQTTIATMRGLKDIGVKLAMDDFGTGYSSLRWIKEFPLDCLKIDRSFIMDICSNVYNHSIVKTIAALTESLQLQTIAEGVENEDTAKILNGFGCTIHQGFHYSRPIEEHDVSNTFRILTRSVGD